MTKEYIERDDVLNDPRWAQVMVFGDAMRAEEIIRSQPAADVVEVVRCKDCWKSAEGLCSYQLKNIPGKDFCGDGERRDDNG